MGRTIAAYLQSAGEREEKKSLCKTKRSQFARFYVTTLYNYCCIFDVDKSRLLKDFPDYPGTYGSLKLINTI